MLCIGSSVGVLVTGRLLQGLSAAVVWVVGLALLVDTVGEKDIGQVMGYVSLSMTIGILAGPLLGGVVYEKGGYYSVFAMAFALIGLDILLRLLMVEKKIARQWLTTTMRRDYADCTYGAPPPQHLDNGCVEASPQQGKSAREKQGVLNEKESTRLSCFTTRLPPVVTLLKSRRLVAALWGSLVQAALMTSFDSVLPLFVKRTFGWDSTGAGLIFLTLCIPSFSAPVVGWLSDKYGPRWLAASGFLLALPFFTLLRLITHNTIPQIVTLCVLLILIGISITLVMPPLMAEVTYVVQAKENKNPGMFGAGGAYAQAYGLFNCAFAGGCLVGPIWAGFVEDKAGWGTMAWSLGLLSALSAIPAMIWTGGLITKRHDKSDHFRGEMYDDNEATASA
ncbi:MAG: hypothetical protein M1835_002409 [Candelina submexicana]|nr:MAG: hypothetical protein M1835_002409 [Candelina submexicana]